LEKGRIYIKMRESSLGSWILFKVWQALTWKII